MTPIENVLSRLDNRKSGTGWAAKCPAHPDRNPSLSIDVADDGKVLLDCKAGCDYREILKALDLTTTDLFPAKPASTKGQIVATYDYRDEASTLLFQVVRKEPKGFSQRRPDGRGDWVWKLGDTRIVLFKLPELIATDPTHTVYVVEGEKDVEALVDAGHVATCAPQGAGKWSKVGDLARSVLAGRDVIVVADKDDAGRNHARDVVMSLRDVAASVAVVEAAIGKDAADHLGGGKTIDEFVPIELDDLDDTDDADRADEADDEKPAVQVSGRHLNEIADELVGLVVEQNEPPVLFSHADAVSLLDDDHRLHPLDHEALLDVLERRVRPIRYDKSGDPSPGRLAVDVRKVVLRRLRGELPKLNGLATAPFLRPDGSVCSTPGYDVATELYLLDGVNVTVPDEPTDNDIAAAVELIDELLYDFPLAASCDRAHCFSLALTFSIRHLVPLVPMHVFDGNNAGVGKNLLAETISGIHHGFGDDDRLPTDPMPTDEEEMRKQITTHMADGRRAVLWDEAHYVIGRQLARLLTSVQWSDRYLGSNVTIRARNLLTCVSLGNQVEIVGDLRRRVIKVSLQSPDEAPNRRTGFRHPNLLEWAAEHRGDLLSAVLTLLRAWHVRGRPGIDDTLGSFEAWTNIIGGTLVVAGVPGFLANVSEVLEEADSLDAEFAGHLANLAEINMFGTTEFSVPDVLKRVRADVGAVLPSGINAHSESAAEALGKLYRRYRNRPLAGGFKLERAGMTHGRARWRVAVRSDRVGMGGHGWGSTRAETSAEPKQDAATPINNEINSYVDKGIPTHPHPSPPRTVVGGRCSVCNQITDDLFGCVCDEVA